MLIPVHEKPAHCVQIRPNFFQAQSRPVRCSTGCIDRTSSQTIIATNGYLESSIFRQCDCPRACLSRGHLGCRKAQMLGDAEA